MRLPSLLLTGVLAVALAGCDATNKSTVDDTPGGGTSAPGGTTTDGAGGQLTEDRIGTGTVTVDGVSYDGISGDCDIMADNGASPVLHAMADNVSIVLGVDNISSGQSSAANKFNFKVLSPKSFTLQGEPSGRGTVNTIVIIEPRVELPEVDLATVGINGVTDDGRPVTAEIVCVLAKP